MDLTHTATIAKRVIIISIILFTLGISAFVGYKLYRNYQIAHTPPPEEKANLKYGTLLQPEFPPTLIPSETLSYNIDTKTGGLPKSGNSIRVYFMPKPFATLLAADKSARVAAKFEISSGAQVITETKYRFSQDDKNLTIDIDSSNFTYTQDVLEEAETGPIDEDSKLTLDFQNFLSSRGFFRDELREGRTKLQLVNFDDSGNISIVSSRSEAKGAQISIWPQDLDKKPIVTPDFSKALINAIIQTSAQKLENIKILNYTFWPTDKNSFAVYPLKSSQEAYDELKNGKGVVVLKPPKKDVSISSIYLAYFQPEVYTPYLQPVYVFEGSSFAAYVTAIKNEVPSSTPK